MNIIHDEEFGDIKISKVTSNYIRIRVDENRRVSVSMPRLTPLFVVRKFLDRSRPDLRRKIKALPEPAEKLSESEKKALRKTAEFWLKHRLHALARQYGFQYERVRIMNAKTRWGSCSSRGTISLNVALMRLPETLRNYVILHELTHTRHMNHSAAFWAEVERYYPKHKEARRRLKKYSPHL
jgi:predicted metal-dependent hydrolase